MSEEDVVKDKFENIKSEYLREWLNILCDTEARYREFVNKFLDENCIFLSATMYQNQLKLEGRGSNFEFDNIQKAVDEGNETAVGSFFQELFIEPIDNEAIRRLIVSVKKEKIKLTDIMDIHKENNDIGFWLALKKLI